MSLLSLGTDDTIVLTVYSMLLFRHASEITQRRGTLLFGWPAAKSRDWNQTVAFLNLCFQVTLVLNKLKCRNVLEKVFLRQHAASGSRSGKFRIRASSAQRRFTLKIHDANLGSALYTILLSLNTYWMWYYCVSHNRPQPDVAPSDYNYYIIVVTIVIVTFIIVT